MDGLLDRDCSHSGCEDSANLFCRLCNLHFCPDHSCLHINAAQMTYSQRLDKNLESTSFDFGAKDNVLGAVQKPQDTNIHVEDGTISPDQLLPNPALFSAEIQNPTVSMAEMSDDTLRDWYGYYLDRAKKYRAELEKRAAPFARTYFGDRATEVLGRIPKAPKPGPKVRSLAKSKVRALEYLQQQIKLGNLTVDQIAGKIK